MVFLKKKKKAKPSFTWERKSPLVSEAKHLAKFMPNKIEFQKDLGRVSSREG